MKTILWTLPSKDWDKSQNSSGQIIKKVMNNLFNGMIVGMHDFDPADNPDAGSNRDGMLIALKQILIKGKAQGYDFVTIEEMLKVKIIN